MKRKIGQASGRRIADNPGRWMMSIENKQRYAQRMERVLAYVESHLDEPLSVASLSEIAAFSPWHFHRQFTAYTGLPVYRMVQLLRLKRASQGLAFATDRQVLDVALEAGFESAEAFSRAFKRVYRQSPTAFRNAPHWRQWWQTFSELPQREGSPMDVEIVEFPRTPIALLAHHGPEHLVYDTVRQFISWRRRMGIAPDRARAFGLHYADTTPEDYRFEVAVSFDGPVAANPEGVVGGEIAGGRCARVRHHGSREHIPAADWLYRDWVPRSGEELRDAPFFFHYVNVGPDVRDADMVTDLYLPLR